MDAVLALALKIADQHQQIEELSGRLETAEKSSSFWYSECKKKEADAMFGEMTAAHFIDMKEAIK